MISSLYPGTPRAREAEALAVALRARERTEQKLEGEALVRAIQQELTAAGCLKTANGRPDLPGGVSQAKPHSGRAARMVSTHCPRT